MALDYYLTNELQSHTIRVVLCVKYTSGRWEKSKTQECIETLERSGNISNEENIF